jgi:hypothetical protein
MNKKIIVGAIIGAVMVMCAGVGIGVGINANKTSDSELSVAKESSKASTSSETSTLKNITGGKLYEGTYTVGQDLKEGVYTFKYATTFSEHDYISLDYLRITNAGSKKVNTMLGGWNFEKASNGDAISHINLHNGDVVNVSAKYGEWTY